VCGGSSEVDLDLTEEGKSLEIFFGRNEELEVVGDEPGDAIDRLASGKELVGLSEIIISESLVC